MDCFIFLTIFLLEMKDTAAEADRERNLINQKLLLSVFKSMGAFTFNVNSLIDTQSKYKVYQTSKHMLMRNF